jgi:hypothetical protein
MAKTIGQLTALGATPDAADEFVIAAGGVTKKITAANAAKAAWELSGNKSLYDGANIVLGATTGSKIGTDPATQKLGFWNATPVVQPAAVANLTVTATSGSLPAANGAVTIANASTPTVAELLEYCVELEAKLEDLLGKLRTIGLIAT